MNRQALNKDSRGRKILAKQVTDAAPFSVAEVSVAEADSPYRGKPYRVGLASCVSETEGKPAFKVAEKYLRALVRHAGVPILPLMVPALEGLDVAALSSTLDGLLLPGSLSNVNPERYGAQQSSDAAPYDLQRDALVWPLVDALAAKGKPLFGICRGMQELNAIWGGSLCPRLDQQASRMDHRFETGEIEQRYGVNHMVRVIDGEWLDRLWRPLTPGLASSSAPLDVAVNSLHWQGVARLGAGLQVEARAPDGLIEAFHATDVPGFVFGVQWHPEVAPERDPYSAALFRRFGQALAAAA